MISKQKFDSLLNGGGAAAGVKGLSLEIKGLEAEIETARTELGTMPAKRADLILADNAAVAIDKLENRERELERLIERNSLQITPLKQRVAALRRTELGPRIKHHEQVLAKIEGEIADAVRALMALNQNAADALRAAQIELGDEGTPYMTLVQYAAPANETCFEIWRGNLAAQRERIAFAMASEGKPFSRVPAFDLNDLRPPAIRRM